MEMPQALGNASCQFLRLRAKRLACHQLLEHGLNEAADLLAVAALTGLAELGVQSWQLVDAPDGGVLAIAGDGRCPYFFPQRCQERLKCLVQSPPPLARRACNCKPKWTSNSANEGMILRDERGS